MDMRGLWRLSAELTDDEATRRPQVVAKLETVGTTEFPADYSCGLDINAPALLLRRLTRISNVSGCCGQSMCSKHVCEHEPR